MNDTTASLRRKIDSAGNLQSVVRTMKALAASSISQYEQSVRALGDYYHTVELGLGVCFRDAGASALIAGETKRTNKGVIGAVVLGSDQGLVPLTPNLPETIFRQACNSEESNEHMDWKLWKNTQAVTGRGIYENHRNHGLKSGDR